MRTLKLTLAYDGTRYAGWQIQRSIGRTRTSRPTIQATIERAFQRILQEPVKVVASGRTDAGVHALAQVAHARTRSSMPCRRLLRGVNHVLPSDIAVSHIEETDPAFHARFSARRKSYRYRLFTGAVVPPFIRPYVHHMRARLNVALMRREAAALRGRHDFRAFTRAGSAGATTRTIYAIALRRRGQELHLDMEGNGFLRTMVRSLTGTLVDIGRGRLPSGTVRRMLTRKTRRLAGTTAPAAGLFLVCVTYAERPARKPASRSRSAQTFAGRSADFSPQHIADREKSEFAAARKSERIENSSVSGRRGGAPAATIPQTAPAQRAIESGSWHGRLRSEVIYNPGAG